MLHAENLTCRRGARAVLRDMTVTANPGDCLLVAGLNGSGKSTLLRALAGLATVQGIIRWNGVAVTDDLTAYHARLHYIGHLDAVKPELTVAEMVEYWRTLNAGERCRHNFSFGVEAWADRSIRFLSAGQKRRLALTRLLLTNVPLWLLDEPTTTLDAAGQGLLLDAIACQRAQGGIVIIATHDPLPIPQARSLSLTEAVR